MEKAGNAIRAILAATEISRRTTACDRHPTSIVREADRVIFVRLALFAPVFDTR
jgi:hypothetical protein